MVAGLRDWELDGQVGFLSFDTTVLNLEKNTDACVLIEQELGKNLLLLICHHNVQEFIFSAVFKKVPGTLLESKV